MLRLDVCLFHDVPNLSDQIRLRDLLARKIDAHEQMTVRGRLPLPLTKLLASFLQNPKTDGNDKPGIFSQRNKVRWINKSTLGMLPANQRFESGKRAVIERNDRLIVDAELFAIERAPQVILHLQQIHRLCMHALVEHFIACLALRFGPVHRRVGVAQHVLRMIVSG